MIAGIDLGTTFSAIAFVNGVGAPVLCPDRFDGARFHTPSVAHIGARGCFVGELVEQMIEEDPALPICRFAKAGMGREEPVFHDHRGRAFSAEAISALILRKLRMDADVAQKSISRAIISVPAHFNEAQQRATINAARLADIPIVGLVQEPVAAATFAAATSPGKEKTVFVFDLGGGTLDATILQSSPEGLYVVATEGEPDLGGRNFDEVIMNLVLEQYIAQFGFSPKDDMEAMQRLRTFATRTKIELSQSRVPHVTHPLLLAGRSLRVTLSRMQFESAATPLIEAALDVCRRVLNGAHLSWEKIDELVFVGGGSLLPCVETAVIKTSGLSPERIRRNQPHSAVAYGVALLAEQQFGQRETIAPPLRQLVSTNDLGLRMFDPVRQCPFFHVMIERNVPLPAAHHREIYTSSDRQEMIAIEVLQRKNEHVEPERLDFFHFGPLPHPQKNYPLQVELAYDSDGRVRVAVRDGKTGEEIKRMIAGNADADLTATYGLLNTLELQS